MHIQTNGDRLRRAGRIRSLTLGPLRVTHVPDGVGTLLARKLLPDATEDFWAEHPEFLDESQHLVTGNGGLLVELGARALLIDAGMGPVTVGPPLNPFGTVSGGDLLTNLATIGRPLSEIGAVAFTHLHPDHLGWAWTRDSDSDVLPFARAQYLVAAPEWQQRGILVEQGLGGMVDVVESQVHTVTAGEEIFPGVHVLSAPGHSPGHVAYVIEADDQRVIAFGDAFHSPVQIAHPLWDNTTDHDRELAKQTRMSLIRELAEPGTIGFGVHFADVAFGRVVINDAPEWLPVHD